ncbi:hypothetical protein SBOR_8105 [Sclerotinia borealis F-4128]|uniref:Uncharacterized protein n=1 Tax=Sclerotinia borealis (strain F-4128) TaxID=1432307 RepID=W9C425_SCLBF|nr:hypothetical protein SBOR_8105 [Sclerotinia borealis F-4128]
MPRTRSRQTRLSRRSPPREANTGNGVRSKLKESDICVGCIVWLPPKIEGDGSLVCVRGKSCCNGKKLDDDGYNHPVVILYYKDTTCYIAMITSKTRRNVYTSKRIQISQNPPDPDDLDLDPECKLYLETGEMNKTSFIIIEHLFPIQFSILRSISFKPQSRAFDTRLRKQSYVELVAMFDMDEGMMEWVDTGIVKAKDGNGARRGQREQRVTFRDPWEEIRGDTATATSNREIARQSLARETRRQSRDQRISSEPTPTTTIPALSSIPRTQATLPATPREEWYSYDRSQAILRNLANERDALLQHQPPPYSLSPITQIQSTWHQQTQLPSRPSRLNYHAALPSVERYDRSHWDARIRNMNMRVHDLEHGGRGGEEGRGDGGGVGGKLKGVMNGN